GSSDGSARSIISASRWQPAPVLICRARAPAARMRSAARSSQEACVRLGTLSGRRASRAARRSPKSATVAPMVALATSCWLGFLIGLRHALDPDHLAAMSTLLVDQPRRGRAAVLGAWWGVGHSASLLGAGALLLVCRVRLPVRA